MSIMQGSFFFSLSKIVNVCGWKFKHVNTLAKLPPHNNGLVESGCMYQVNENQFISTDFQKQINHHSSCNRNVNDSVSHFSTWMWFFRRCNFFFFFPFLSQRKVAPLKICSGWSWVSCVHMHNERQATGSTVKIMYLIESWCKQYSYP